MVRIKNKSRNIIALVLIIVLMLQIPFTAFSYGSSDNKSWDGETIRMPLTDKDGIFMITDCEELAWFSDQINKGNNEISCRLMNNIYINSDDNFRLNRFPVIGVNQNNPFKGTFDGNGFEIVNPFIETDGKNGNLYTGIFGVIDGGEVRNLNVSGGVFFDHYYQKKHPYDGHNEEFYLKIMRIRGAGAIAGYLKKGIISGCNVYNTKLSSGVEGDVLSTITNLGGIAGISEGLILGCRTGHDTQILNLHGEGVGGIAGQMRGPEAETMLCVNDAEITSEGTDVGGIAGMIFCGAEISDCSNYGEISGLERVGGIAGISEWYGIDADGNNKSCVISDVYNLGKITYSKYDPEYPESSKVPRLSGGIIGSLGYNENDRWPVYEKKGPAYLRNAFSALQPDLYGNMYDCVGGVVGFINDGAVENISTGKDKGTSSYYVPVGFANKAVKQTNVSLENYKVFTDVIFISELQYILPSDDFLLYPSSPEKIRREIEHPSLKRDSELSSYPSLKFESYAGDVKDKYIQTVVDLKKILNDENRKKYGKTYAEVEKIVTESIDTVLRSENLKAPRLDKIKKDTFKRIEKIQEGIVVEEEKGRIIDQAKAKLDTYYDELLSKNQDLTEKYIKELDNILEKYIGDNGLLSELEKDESLVDIESINKEIKLIVRDGKYEMEEVIRVWNEDKRLEEIRNNALISLEQYRSEEIFEDKWNKEIIKIKEDGKKKLIKAESSKEVRKILKSIENEIDEFIENIPGKDTWDGTKVKEPLADENGVYEIYTGSELAWFANEINKGNNSIDGKLCSDIYLGNHKWKPIGTENPFRGHFNGNNFTIRGLNVEDNYKYSGLFGYVYSKDNKPSVENLTVKGKIAGNQNVHYAGGIAGYVSGIKDRDMPNISDCHSDVNISIGNVIKSGAAAGGIAGYVFNSYVDKCSNKGSVSYVSEGKGGILYYAAGITGMINGNTIISECCNTGVISAYVGAGGIAGVTKGNNVNIHSCYNNGDVNATVYAGGLVAETSGIDFVIDSSYNSGPVSFNSGGKYIGALFGKVINGDYRRLIALKGTATATAGYVTGNISPGRFMYSEELKARTTVDFLNNTYDVFIPDYLGIQNGYPVFKWQMSVEDFKIGAIEELKNFGKEEDYDKEVYNSYLETLNNAIDKITKGENYEQVSAALDDGIESLSEFETKKEAEQRILEKTIKEYCIEINDYVNPEDYDDLEKSQIKTIIYRAVAAITDSESIDEAYYNFTEARKELESLPTSKQNAERNDMVRAEEVTALIAEIGPIEDMSYTEYIKIAINVADEAFQQLTDEQKRLVKNKEHLEKAIEKFKELEEKQQGTIEDKKLAEAVDELITAIGNIEQITINSNDAITTARKAYDILTYEQKLLVSHPEKLQQAEIRYNEVVGEEMSAEIASIGKVSIEKKEQIFDLKAKFDMLSEVQKNLVTDADVLNKAIKKIESIEEAGPVIVLIDKIGKVTLNSEDSINNAIKAYNNLSYEAQQEVNNHIVLLEAIELFKNLKVEEKNGEQVIIVNTDKNLINSTKDRPAERQPAYKSPESVNTGFSNKNFSNKDYNNENPGDIENAGVQTDESEIIPNPPPAYMETTADNEQENPFKLLLIAFATVSGIFLVVVGSNTIISRKRKERRVHF